MRLTSAGENYKNQHTVTDTFANTSVPYATRVGANERRGARQSGARARASVAELDLVSGPNKGGHDAAADPRQVGI